MTCRSVRGRLSAYRDGDLPFAEARAITTHLQGCAACAGRRRSLEAAIESLAGLPRLAPGEPISARVLGRLELESRGPGLALLFRPAWRARPLIFPALVPAALVLVTVLAAALALHHDPYSPPTIVIARGERWEGGRLPPSGTEANPLFPSADVLPQVTARGSAAEGLLAQMDEGTLFLETVVARDGSVSSVTLLDGDEDRAGPLLEALRRERFVAVRRKGRPVAVSVYRLISRIDVRAPVT